MKDQSDKKSFLKIGITTFDLYNSEFQVQLNSMLINGVAPDFILLHYAGFYSKIERSYRFIKKTIKQYRLKSIQFILNRNKYSEVSGIKFTLSENEKSDIDSYLRKTMIIKVSGINDKSTINIISKLGKTLIVSNSGILKSEVINLPETIFLNIHASRLPQYRGMNNVEWALFENNPIYITIHKISRGIDEGDILYQEKINVENIGLKLISDYRNYIFQKGYEAVGKSIKKFLDNEIGFVEQMNKQEPILQYYVMHPILKKKLQERLYSLA